MMRKQWIKKKSRETEQIELKTSARLQKLWMKKKKKPYGATDRQAIIHIIFFMTL